MTPPFDWIPLAALGLNIVVVGAGAVYLRGKLDAHQSATDARIDELCAKVDHLDGEAMKDARRQGGDDVRAIQFTTLVQEVKDVGNRAVTATASLDAHIKECDRRQSAIWERFDKVDRSLDGVARQLLAIATGQAGKVYEIKS